MHTLRAAAWLHPPRRAPRRQPDAPSASSLRRPRSALRAAGPESSGQGEVVHPALARRRAEPPGDVRPQAGRAQPRSAGRSSRSRRTSPASRSASCCRNTAQRRRQDRDRPLGDLAARRARHRQPLPADRLQAVAGAASTRATGRSSRTSAAAGRRCRRTSRSRDASDRRGRVPRHGPPARSRSAATRPSPTSASATSTSSPASPTGRMDRRREFLAAARPVPAEGDSNRRPDVRAGLPAGHLAGRPSRRSTCRRKSRRREPLRPAHDRPELPAGPAAGRARRAVRHRPQHRLGHARRPGAAAQGGLHRGEGRRRPDPDVRPGVRGAGRRPERARPARRDAGGRDGRVRPHAEAEHVPAAATTGRASSAWCWPAAA